MAQATSTTTSSSFIGSPVGSLASRSTATASKPILIYAAQVYKIERNPLDKAGSFIIFGNDFPMDQPISMGGMITDLSTYGDTPTVKIFDGTQGSFKTTCSTALLQKGDFVTVIGNIVFAVEEVQVVPSALPKKKGFNSFLASGVTVTTQEKAFAIPQTALAAWQKYVANNMKDEIEALRTKQSSKKRIVFDDPEEEEISPEKEDDDDDSSEKEKKKTVKKNKKT